MIKTEKIVLHSEGNFYPFNLTEKVRWIVKESGVKEGNVLVFYQHATGVLTLLEHEAGVMVDLEDAMNRWIPLEQNYAHHLRGVDDNGAAHIRNALLNSSLVIPILDGNLGLGKYQEIILIDMQTEHSPRSLLVQVWGE
jgi:secondary thiamine-phosphate synthase enzyme